MLPFQSALTRTAAEGSNGSGKGSASARENIDGPASRLLGLVTLSGVRRERRLAVPTTVNLSPEWRVKSLLASVRNRCSPGSPECQAAPMRGSVSGGGRRDALCGTSPGTDGVRGDGLFPV